MLASFGGKKWAWYTLSLGEKGVCNLLVLFQGLRVERVEHSMHLKAPGEVYWRQFLLWRLELVMGCSHHP